MVGTTSHYASHTIYASSRTILTLNAFAGLPPRITLLPVDHRFALLLLFMKRLGFESYTCAAKITPQPSI